MTEALYSLHINGVDKKLISALNDLWTALDPRYWI